MRFDDTVDSEIFANFSFSNYSRFLNSRATI